MKSAYRRACLLAVLAVCLFPTAVSWGQFGGAFEFPYAVAVDGTGNVYVSEHQRYRINKLDPQGTVLWRSGTPGAGPDQFSGPAGIALDSAGFIYVADAYNARIQKLHPTGASAARWGSYGSGPGQFHRPAGLFVDSRDHVYVLDSALRRIQKFTNDGATVLGQWGSAGTGDGQFTPLGGGPREIVIDAAGNAYITDTSAHRIHKWQIVSNPTGVIARADFQGWSGRCTSGANCDVANQRSRGFTCTAATCSGGGPGNLAGQFSNVFGLALDTQGNLFVTDFDNDRVQKFDASGNFLTMWGGRGTGLADFRGPLGVAAFGTTAVYVADMRNKRVLKFNNAGSGPVSIGGDIFLSASPGYPPANLDALVDPNPLFALPSQTKTSRLRVESLALFQGPIALTPGCCQNFFTSGPAAPSGVGVAISVAPTSVDVPAIGFEEATITIATTSSPTPGKFLAVITGTNVPKAVSREMGLTFELIRDVPDSTAVPCSPGFAYQGGMLPEVGPLRGVLRSVFAAKAAQPSRTQFSMGVVSTLEPLVGWQLDIDKATGLTSPLAANEMLVVMRNDSRSRKAAFAIGSPSCATAGIAAVITEPTETRSMRISAPSTTTLVLGRQGRDLMVFSEPNFWTLFGGRRLTITCIGR